VEKKNIVLRLVLTFVTCGLYGLYWMYEVTNEVQRETGRQETATGGMAALYAFITCSIYYLYWLYKTSGEIGELRRERGLAPDGVSKETYIISAIVVFIISIGFGILRVMLAALVLALGEENGMTDEDMMDAASTGIEGLSGIFWSLILAAVFIWLVSRRKPEDNPRLINMAAGVISFFLIFEPMLTLGFLQKSLNELAEQSAKGGTLS